MDGVRTGTTAVWVRAAALAVLLAVAAVLALTLELPTVGDVRDALAGAGPLGWTALVAGVALVLLAPVPRSAVSVLVAVVVGFWAGLAVAFAGGILAGLAAFGLSRSLGRAAVARLSGPRLTRFDDAVVGRGFAAVLTGRLVPVVPFVVVSYGAGLTGMRFAPYAAATAVGLVPSTLVQVGVGASVAAVVPGRTALLLAGLLALAVVVPVAVWRRRARLTPS
ncbi:TVP38/TMEM64 family protein [Blastococcus sp. TF02A-30]|uniref:TVP38/TMEM64 family protein n=1 Tax=Blastococcus sp. TF02A-30 TaxID=2250580 RepID=UPI000DEBD4A4|nr:VTT domain-containing protein [Blastococcus sp. TF02A-30]RBY83233.1 TVP38/TMEM64 family protein [Blastococcus sp. TF02A-30]